ncbi:uncharacterized protein [Lepidochelys kempii]|uniref:uncharacterized protein isoform X5 n=1 Tax=Lepidochelys kempii TaxID=8472 RepID=UPI003C6EBECC
MLLDTETRKASILASLQALGKDSANGRNRRNHRRKLISDPSPAVCGCLPPGKLLHGSKFTDGILQRGNLTGSLTLERVKLTKAKLGKKFRIPKGKGDSRCALSQSLQHIMSSAQEDQACFKPNLLFRFQKAAKSIVMLCLLYKEHHLLYESCQVMIQQGYTPHSFYICLSGSATVIKRNSDSGQVKPAWFFSRGDAFGDREIINGDYWQTTVIIQEPAEFLCIDREDFIKIFLSGGKNVFGDPEQMQFLRSLHCFKGWPINLLEDNPGKCIVCHYRRGTVILRNSNVTEWIYIVKEGSCSVLKIFQDDSCLSNRAPANRIMQAEAGIHQSLLTSRTDTPVIIALDTLPRGSVFGLLDFLFEDQPNLCVVSNGAECLKISKKFYLHHASKDLLQRLRKKEHSYPSEAELKEQLQQEIQWQIFRKAALKSTVQQIELKRKLLQHSYMSKGLYTWCKN